jgi:surface polysaccharide O-acyltransferase-like enzyme
VGYYLNKTSLNFDKKKVIYVLLVLTGILITIFGTYITTKYNGSFYVGFYNYLSPNVILVSVGIFLLFKDFIRFNSKYILFFSKYSYGTFLIHVLLLTILGKKGLNYAFINPIIGIPITSVICFVVSTLIIWGVNKLPLGKYISG